MFQKIGFVMVLSIIGLSSVAHSDASVDIEQFKKECAKKYAFFAGRCSFVGFKNDSCGEYEDLNPDMNFPWVEEKECRYRNAATDVEVTIESETSRENNTYEKVKIIRNRDGSTSEKITQCEVTRFTRVICVCAPCSESDVIHD